MKHLVSIVIAAALSVPCYGQADRGSAKTGHSVQCRILADGKTIQTKAQQVSKGKTAILHVALENLSDNAVETTGMMAFLGIGGGGSPILFPARSSPEFNAVIDIEKKSALEVTLDLHGTLKYPEQRLTLAPHQLLTFDLDIAKLKWERMSSSLYSATSFWATVPPGTYGEHLSITGRDATGRFDVESNEITLAVSS